MSHGPEGDSARRRRLDLFDRALSQPPAEREPFVRGEAGADQPLAESVLDMLRAADDFDSQRLLALLPTGDHADLPTTIGPYRVLAEIGRGGMGVVYHARRDDPPQEVAIKLPRLAEARTSAALLARFERERRLLAAMNHRCIARLLDLGTLPTGQPWLAMEYVPGPTLTEYCAHADLPLRPRLELFLMVCDAVQHAHTKTVVHRDLKPENVLVVEEDGKPVPKVLDFGLAKLRQEDGERSSGPDQSIDGSPIGTPLYGSPEQVLGRLDEVDIRSDVYSLGVMLYRLLAGELPFPQQAMRQLRQARGERVMLDHLATSMPPRPSQRAQRGGKITAKTLRGDLDRIVMQAMAKEPRHRYATVQALAEDLRRFVRHEPVQATAPSFWYVTWRFVQRHRGAVTAAATLVVGLSIAAMWTQSYAEAAARSDQKAAAVDAQLMLQSASDAFRGGDWERTLTLLDRADRMEQVDVDGATALRIRALLQSERREDATALVAGLEPQRIERSPALLLGAAELASQTNDKTDAGRDNFARALASGQLDASDSAYARSQLAPDLPTMERELRAALRLVPTHLMARRSLMALCMLQGRMVELRQLVEEAIVLFPNDLFARLLLPWSGVATGQTQEPELPAELASDLDARRQFRVLGRLPKDLDGFFGSAARAITTGKMLDDHRDERELRRTSSALAGSVFQAVAVAGQLSPSLHFALPLRQATNQLNAVAVFQPMVHQLFQMKADPSALARIANEFFAILPDPLLLSVALGMDPALKDDANLARWRTEGPRLADACRLTSGPLYALPGGRRLTIFSLAAAMHYRVLAGEHTTTRTAADGQQRTYAEDLQLLADLAATTPGMTATEIAWAADKIAVTDRPLADRLFMSWELQRPGDGLLRMLHGRWLLKGGDRDRALQLAEESVRVEPDCKPAAAWLASLRPATPPK
jgi:serine/threonine protein kinase